MNIISAAQVKAARALLGWSQDQLALEANVSVTTIRNLESGEMSLRNTTMNIIRHVMEKSGIEFTDGEGVRRRNHEVKILGCGELFEDMLRTVRDNNCDGILAMFPSPDILIELCGLKAGKLGRLEEICRHASIECLIGEVFDVGTPPPASPAFRFRTSLKQHIGYASYFVYGTKQAMVLAEGTSSFRFYVLDSFNNALSFRKHFTAMWEAATPVNEAIKRPRRDDRRILPQ